MKICNTIIIDSSPINDNINIIIVVANVHYFSYNKNLDFSLFSLFL